MWKNLSNFRDGALLFLRIVFGGFFIYAHGWPQLTRQIPAAAIITPRVSQ